MTALLACRMSQEMCWWWEAEMVASLERWHGTQALRRFIWRRLMSMSLLSLPYHVFTGQTCSSIGLRCHSPYA